MHFLLTILHGSVSAQAQQRTPAQQKPDPDRLGLSCAQILQMSSYEWIAKITSIDDSTTDGNLRVDSRLWQISRYDQRTDRLAASLAKKSGKGPLDGRGAEIYRDFGAVVAELHQEGTLGMPTAPADAVKSAYAALYEKQFRYAFYQSYEQQDAKPSPAAAAKPGAKIEPAAQPTSPKSPPASPVSPPAAAGATPATNAPPATKEVDPFTLAKNHFGELLSDLPDDNMHDLHAAFGDVLVRNSVGASTAAGDLSLRYFSF